MIDPTHFRQYVIDPTLKSIGLYSEAASNLLLGTAIQESRLTYLHQLKGPALGLYQIEPSTFQDVYAHYLNYVENVNLQIKVNDLVKPNYPYNLPFDRQIHPLITNMAYATAIARVIYYRRPEPLPDADDLLGLAQFWKLIYNTPKGAGNPEQFIENYEKWVSVTR